MSKNVVDFKGIKNWNVEVENKITSKWMKSELFRFNKNAKKIYSIDTPPPYINAPIHMGHAVTYAYQDFFARYKRMKGFEVLFPLGLDRNGLPIEMGAEKKFKVSPFKIGREEFIKYCEKLLDETTTESTDTFSKIGISFTSYKYGDHIGAIYHTDASEYRALTQATLINLYKKGLLYEDVRVNNWDSKLQTTIADSEIDYENISSTFNHVEWKVKETGEKIVLATTRPELISTCGKVIFNPEDERYKHLEGKTAIIPLFEKEVGIMSHPFADPEKGSGIVMMCAGGDLTDIQFFREQKLKPIIAIGKDGKMTENAGFLEGMNVKEARKEIIKRFKKEGLLVKQEEITHRTPISERSKVEVEFIEMPEFYLKQLKFKDDVRRVSKKIDFYPEFSRKILDDWVDSVSIDWPVSRRRFYATEIPLWYCKEKGLVAVPKPGKYYKPWKDKVPRDAEVFENGKLKGKVGDDKFKEFKWEGEERVCDTWIDSSISQLYILKYKEDMDFFKKAFPATLRPQGKEIVRTWLYYSILRGFLETGKPCFRDVWVHQHILDGKGKKMSKSLGNVIDPQEILKEFGGEALRLWGALEGDISKQDLACSKERIKAELKTLNKILNVSKFVMLFEKPKKPKAIVKMDGLFIDYLEDLTERIDKNYSEYDFNHPAIELRWFLWEIFASHYIEMIKSRAYNSESKFSKEESGSAKYTLHFLLERFLTLIYPIIPQITTIIANEKGINLLKAEYPKAKKGKSDLELVKRLMDFNREVWKKKRGKEISLRDSIEGIKIPKKLKDFEKDLKECHGLR